MTAELGVNVWQCSAPIRVILVDASSEAPSSQADRVALQKLCKERSCVLVECCTVSQLKSALREGPAHVFHVAHGVASEDTDFLLLEGEVDRLEGVRLSFDELVDLLAAAPPVLAVLCCCHGDTLAEKLHKMVPAVISCTTALQDLLAERFAGAFYGSLATAADVAGAFHAGLEQSKQQLQDRILKCREELASGDLTVRGAQHRQAALESLRCALENARDLLLRERPVPADAHASAPAQTTPMTGTLKFVPPLPEVFVPRLHVTRHVVNAIVAASPSESVLAVVSGLGGIGKTVLCSAAVRDPRVLARFELVVWLAVGSEPAILDILVLLLDTVCGGALKETPQHIAKAQEAIRTAMGDRAVLVVFDDVWEQRHAEQLLVALDGCRNSVALVSTRQADALPESATRVFGGSGLVRLTHDEACSLVLQGSTKASNLTHAVADLCDGHALTLALVGALVQDGLGWADVLAILSESHFSRTSHFRSLWDDGPPLLAVFDESVKRLSADDRARFLQIGIFPEDTAIGLSPLRALWNVSEALARATMVRLRNASLVMSSSFRTDGAGVLDCVSVHDLARQYVCMALRNDGLQIAHAALLDGYWAQRDGAEGGGDGWWRVRNDGYFLRHAARHFIGAGRSEELRALLLEYEWVATAIKVLGVAGALREYKAAMRELREAPTSARGMVERTLGSMLAAAQTIVDDPGHIAEQLYERLKGVVETHPELGRLVADARARCRMLLVGLRGPLESEMIESPPLPLSKAAASSTRADDEWEGGNRDVSIPIALPEQLEETLDETLSTFDEAQRNSASPTRELRCIDADGDPSLSELKMLAWAIANEMQRADLMSLVDQPHLLKQIVTKECASLEALTAVRRQQAPDDSEMSAVAARIRLLELEEADMLARLDDAQRLLWGECKRVDSLPGV